MLACKQFRSELAERQYAKLQYSFAQIRQTARPRLHGGSGERDAEFAPLPTAGRRIGTLPVAVSSMAAVVASTVTGQLAASRDHAAAPE
jgi:hypothetical protein